MRAGTGLLLALAVLAGCATVGQGMQSAGGTISAEAANPRNEIRTEPRGSGGNSGY